MWSSKIEEFQKENKISLDLKHELHLCFYIKHLLNDHYEFTTKNKKMIISDLNLEADVSQDAFYYWWSFQRFDELTKEETKLYNEFNDLKKKILSAIEKIKLPELKDKDDSETKKKKIDKINSNNEKTIALQDHLKSEADTSNRKINNLRNFRSLYPSIDSLERFLKNIKIIIENE